MSKAILVTGANGFVGRPLVDALASRGILVHTHTSNLGDIAHCPLDFDDVGHVIHLAGRSYVPDSWKFTFRFYEVNLLGTVNVLEFCRRHHAALTFVSSYVYGVPDALPITEEHRRQPFNPYSHSKIAAEDLVSYYKAQFDIRTTIVRPFNIYGPGQSPHFLIPTLVRQALDPTTAEIVVADLRPRRDYLNIQDFVSFLIATLSLGGGGTYNAGSGYSVSITDLVQTITSLTGMPKPIRSLEQHRPTEVLDVVADISKARAQLHWAPAVALREGLQDTIAWTREAKPF